MQNPAVATYEAAYKLLKEPSAFATTHALPHPAPLLFRLTGMDEPLAWPLSAAQAAQIAALYPAKIISASDIPFEERYMDGQDDMLAAMNWAYFEPLAPSSTAYTVLSHMVVDDVGDADSFRLQPSNDDDINATTFGVLIVLLPSAHTGGVITLAHAGQLKTFGDDVSLIETPFTAAFLSTTITSAPITSGRRVALVYRLCYDDVGDEPMRMTPPAQDAAIAAFQALGHSTSQEVQRLGLELDEPESTLTFAALTLCELGFVNVLLAAGNFDVGLATLSRNRTCDVVAFEPHPACNIPDAVVQSVIGHTLQGFLHLPLRTHVGFQSPSDVLVFWPRRHRVCFADIADLWAFLERRLERGDDDDDGAFLGAMPLTGAHGSSLIKVERGRMHWLQQQTRNLACFEKLHQLVMAIEDVQVSTALLYAIATSGELFLTSVALVVHGLLSKHGWGLLESAMLELVRRWIKRQPHATLQLLTSLAGLDDDEAAVCPPLSQPFEAELFKRCYDVVLTAPDLDIGDFDWCYHGPTFAKGLFLLDHYVTTIVPQLQDANYASQRLPLILVPAIDAFLFDFPSVVDVLSSSTVLDPLIDIAVGLASAVRCQPELPLPPAVMDRIVMALQSPMTVSGMAKLANDHANVAAAVLVLASRSQRLDAALFETLVVLYDLALLPIAASIASQLADDALFGHLVTAYIRASVPALVDRFKLLDSLQRSGHINNQATVTPGALLFLDVVQLLQSFAPDAIVPFATRYLALLPKTLDTIHDRLVPVLMRLDGDSCVHALLVTATIDRFAAVSALPYVTNFAMPRPVELHPEHCLQCTLVHWFLAQADEAMLQYPVGEGDMCPSVARIVAEASQLRFVVGDGAYIPNVLHLEKVRKPSQVSEDERMMAMHAHVAAFVETLTRQKRGTDDEASTKPTAPPAKRVRRS
ncbi:hypothetical protein SPRG_02902 [Saprolegnia parasitica CBS 223.65]|uniref:Uncharacterized protein n=1 Tax=Saprolegnia parasitica (strain CBS 223.65) TaxID=695850 RepID=A0A067CT39_SAPPC|nr:hypothetical protein SPRG_02902 [Saprolegnia parasitica CBS 223.65]KDO32425.1 hypothetical protein SPRG_02902 [Saprolegnia parasitica CBS 223.65]|eukprot:XP_012196879.1 hypothetical protein SPRG_02902 [Saprolegnia parasitica CBS 223.65]